MGAARFGGFGGALLRGLGAMVGAGVCVGIAPAAAASGSWLPLGVLAAAVLAWCAVSTRRPVNASVLGGFGDSASLVARLVAAAALAGTCGVYLVPDRPLLGAVGLLIVVVVLDAARPRLPVEAAVCVVLAVLAVLVLACFALASPGNRPVPAGLPGADDIAGLPGAAAVMVFAFGGLAGPSSRRTAAVLAVATAGYLAVAFAVLHQLGPGRLAVSPVPLRAALAAAEGGPVDGLITFGVVLATAVASSALLAGVRADLLALLAFGRGGTGWRSQTGTALLFAVAGSVLAWLLAPVGAILLSAAALLLCWGLRHLGLLAGWRAAPRGRSVLALFGALGSLLALAWLPPDVLLVSLAVTLVLGVIGLLAPVGARR